MGEDKIDKDKDISTSGQPLSGDSTQGVDLSGSSFYQTSLYDHMTEEEDLDL